MTKLILNPEYAKGKVAAFRKAGLPPEMLRGQCERMQEAIRKEIRGMSKDLQVFSFENRETRIVMREGQPWWVAKDVCDVLGIQNSSDALMAIDDDEKGIEKVYTPGGLQSMSIINESGLYTLILRSNKPEAKRFRKWVTSEVLPSIRKTGFYSTPNKSKAKENSLAERRLDVMEKNADHRMAMAILKGLDVFKDVMTPESKTVFMVKYGELVTQQDHKHLLPEAKEKWHSATELGNEFGVSAQKIGRLSNKCNLKAPEGESNQYGTWIRSKSKNSEKEVMTWVYYEAGREWFTKFFGKAA